MKPKELFMLIDKIDKRFIDEAWDSANSESFDEIDYENRRGVKVVTERKPFRTVGFALTAACFLLLGAGGMALINLFTGNGIQPNSSMELPPLYGESSSESSTSSENSEPSESSELNESIASGESSDSGEDYLFPQVMSDVENSSGVYELALTILPGHEAGSDGAEKMNNWGFALIDVKETNASEERPIIAQILKESPNGGMEPISQEIYITGRRTYQINYTTLRGAGSYSYLYLAYPIYDDVEFSEDDFNSQAIIAGTWTP